ncbi:hypothetical protein V1511DRAFT_492571 [Dipodascopsis uninucleata]
MGSSHHRRSPYFIAMTRRFNRGLLLLISVATCVLVFIGLITLLSDGVGKDKAYTIHNALAENVGKPTNSKANDRLPLRRTRNGAELMSNGATNQTLGFGTIIYLVIEADEDKLNTARIMSSMLNLDMKILTVPKRSAVEDFVPSLDNSGRQYSSGHLAAWNYMLEKDVSTALIMEDNCDFDLQIRDVLARAFLQIESNSAAARDETTGSIRGWDVLYFSQCKNDLLSGTVESARLYDDPRSVPDLVGSGVTQMLKELEIRLDDMQNGKRLVAYTNKSICSTAYAISKKGALKLLLQKSDMNDDPEVSKLIKSVSIQGYTFFPSIFSTWEREKETYFGIDKQSRGILQRSVRMAIIERLIST